MDRVAIYDDSTDVDVNITSDGDLSVASKVDSSTIQDGDTALTPKFAVINVASSGDNTILAAVSGKKIRVLQYTLVCGSAVNVRFESGIAGTALTGVMEIAANSGISAPYSPVGHFETASNTLLNLELSGAVNVDGHFTYVEI